MTQLVVLQRARPAQVRGGYDVRLGPLSFVTPADAIGESVGDGLEVVGAALLAATRRPRPHKLKLPVRGYERDTEPRESGLRLRRQLRQVLDNPKRRLQGLFFYWTVDPDLDAWLLIGNAEMIETDPGISFGEYNLEMSEVYLVGRPGTHRPGRRCAIADRRQGQAPRDSRRLLYSTDFSTQAGPLLPISVPGDVAELVTSGNRPLGTVAVGPTREGSRHLWRSIGANDGEVVQYAPDSTILPGRTRFLDVSELGAVRIWDLSKASVYPPDTSAYTTERDSEPDVFYGWEAVYGSTLTEQSPLAIENGAVRCIWLGPEIGAGLALEYWDTELNHFRRIGRILHAQGVHAAWVVESTNERGVIEFRVGRYAMRVILQRGWWGPRLESYDDGGEGARLEFAPVGSGAVSIESAGPSWVKRIHPASEGFPILWAQGSADEVANTSPSVLSGPAAAFSRQRVLVAQLSCPPGPEAAELASLSLFDARAVPVLVGH